MNKPCVTHAMAGKPNSGSHRPRLLASLFLFLFVMNVSGCSTKKTQDPEKILREMMRASSDTSFTGIKRFEQRLGNQYFRFRMKISHQPPDLMRLEFLEPVVKRGFIVIRRGGQSWKIGSVTQEPVHFRRFGSYRDLEIRNLDLLLKNYRLHYLGTEQVAQRMADVIQILSRFQPGIERRIWVDRLNRIPLRSEENLSTTAGLFSKRFMYEQIKFMRNLPENLFTVPMPAGSRSMLPRPGQESICLADAKRIAPFPISLPRCPPRGFILEQISWIERPPSGFLHFHYSDGLRAVSLFEEDTQNFHPPYLAALERMAPGSDRVYRMHDGTTTILHRHKDGVHATVVGETGEQELLRMISSLEPAGSS